MYTVKHELLLTKFGESVELRFTVTDRNGEAVDLSVPGVFAVYKVGRNAVSAAVMTKTESSGITFDGNIAIVNFTTDEITEEEVQTSITYLGQLKITKGGDTLYVAEGNIRIDPVID